MKALRMKNALKCFWSSQWFQPFNLKDSAEKTHSALISMLFAVWGNRLYGFYKCSFISLNDVLNKMSCEMIFLPLCGFDLHGMWVHGCLRNDWPFHITRLFLFYICEHLDGTQRFHSNQKTVWWIVLAVHSNPLPADNNMVYIDNAFV